MIFYQNILFSELKIEFDLSLGRSWWEFFKIIKNHGPKNPLPGCNLGPKFSASYQAGHLSENNDDLVVQYEDCPWLSLSKHYKQLWVLNCFLNQLLLYFVDFL